MVSDEQTSQGSDGPAAGVPVAKHVKMKHRLKATINQQEDELTRLRRENDALRQGATVPGQADPTHIEVNAPRPKAADFTDELGDFRTEEFDRALDQWEQSASQARRARQDAEQQSARDKAEIERAVTDHYERAGKLIEQGLVTEPDFVEKDATIRRTLDNLARGKGDELADFLISQIALVSDDSEKLWYKLGASPATLNDVLDAYHLDQTGARGIATLAKLAREVTTPTHRQSRAPKPGRQLQGGNDPGASAAVRAKRRYRDAHQRGDIQAALDARYQAKADGIDISDW